MGHNLLVFGMFICAFQQCISKKQQSKPKQQTGKINGEHITKEINQTLSFYCNNYWHTLINECFFCLLLLWTVGQMCLTKCSPPKYLQNRILEHIAPVMKPLSVPALCQGLPPTLFICSACTMWPGRAYTCASLYLLLPWGELVEAVFPQYDVHVWGDFYF